MHNPAIGAAGQPGASRSPETDVGASSPGLVAVIAAVTALVIVGLGVLAWIIGSAALDRNQQARTGTSTTSQTSTATSPASTAGGSWTCTLGEDHCAAVRSVQAMVDPATCHEVPLEQGTALARISCSPGPPGLRGGIIDVFQYDDLEAADAFFDQVKVNLGVPDDAPARLETAPGELENDGWRAASVVYEGANVVFWLDRSNDTVGFLESDQDDMPTVAEYWRTY